MRLFVCVATRDGNVRQYFGEKGRAIPKDALNRGHFSRQRPTVHINSYSPRGAASEEDFEAFIVQRSNDADACILLVDHDLLFLTRRIPNAVFVVGFNSAEISGNHKGYFDKLLSRSLAALGQILMRFSSANDIELMSLPIRNFHGDELRQLSEIIGNACVYGDLSGEIDKQLKSLRRRVRPRKKSAYKTKYVVDDKYLFFSYGKERHARPETGHPHPKSCELNAYFRFGARIDDKRHYNVSATEKDRTSIEGVFRGCHDDEHPISTRTHLNMFANDYFTK
ncbi:hypothetical protein [Ruegeria sp. HKCCA4008]|uniref:hypothetical protein n=1 Tax=Ruegeria sp. HKCCA4008 TaxID=2682999 RepID=UPI0014879A6C|nr:hypothetical protein [Ruegeria sp. HKCCA4008]